MIRETFRKYLDEAIGSKNALVAFSAFDQPSSVSIRLNPFKKGCSLTGRAVPWNPYGIFLEQRPVFTLDPLFHAGAYYVQDSSSMFVGYMFREMIKERPASKTRPFRVLDLCAAPGGKTTDLAASLRQHFGDDFLLVANEVMKARVGVLADNVALWGDPNVVVTSDDPKAFASMPGYFDVIVTDVPCSGEGMFRKDEEAQRQWSEDNVSLCEARQKRILADVWPALAEGGVLIYSTCTFNRYENDGNVGWVASELGAYVVDGNLAANFSGIIRTGNGYSLVPGHVEGEGQYCAALVKTSGLTFNGSYGSRGDGRSRVTAPADGLEGLMTVNMKYGLKGDVVVAVPEHLHVVSAGCAVGMMKGKIFVPGADLALSIMLDKGAFPACEVDHRTALAYLHRDAVILPDSEKGYVLVCHQGQPLGLVKNLGNRCNSLHPQSRRIRMNIDI